MPNCPLCGGASCTSDLKPNGMFQLLCRTFDFEFCFDEEINFLQPEEKYRAFNLIYEKMLRNPSLIIKGVRRKWHFIYDPTIGLANSEPNYINLADDIKSYPDNAVEKVNRALLNISSKYRNIGDIINWVHGFEYRLLFCDSTKQDDEFRAMYNFMNDLGYLDGDAFSGNGRISFKGWEKIEELKTARKEINQGFIAMSFSNEANFIMQVFKEAIFEAGYKAQIIRDKEHNNQIVPEIFFEIERSKFVVVDITYPNHGAYYEAGYAQALKKQVIVCCRKAEFDDALTRPHFDIAQKAIIIWETEAELKERLTRRIEATVIK